MRFEMSKRTCPWCGVTDVYAVNDERLTIALTDHLKDCDGDGVETRARKV
jgi:hypothetical protein